jgi:hypothetical protein
LLHGIFSINARALLRILASHAAIDWLPRQRSVAIERSALEWTVVLLARRRSRRFAADPRFALSRRLCRRTVGASAIIDSWNGAPMGFLSC